jgi:AcrR family transcriptional regulator
MARATAVRSEPQQERSRETVASVLDATLDLLEDEGYERVTTARIAEKAGISVGTLYHFFPNKYVIMQQLVISWLDAHRRAYERYRATKTPSDLRKHARNHVESLAGVYRDCRALIPLVRTIYANADLWKLEEEYDAWLLEAIATEHRRINPKLTKRDAQRLGRIVTYTIHSCLVETVANNRGDFDQVVDDLCDMVYFLWRKHLRARS